jgi:hypothetical protein
VSSPPLEDDALPALFRAADANSTAAQQTFLRLSSAVLVLVLIAAGAAVFGRPESGTDYFAIVAAVAFAIALLLRFRLVTDQPERSWYDGRAAAESVKTSAWQYAVGGSNFRVTQDTAAADRLFRERVTEIIDEFRGRHLVPVADGSEAQITDAMRRVRSEALLDRIEAYRQGRLVEQIRWYRDKARSNEKSARLWNGVTLGLQTVALGGAILKASGVFAFDALGLASAAIAAAVAWMQTKDYVGLAEAYAVTSQELGAIETCIEGVRSEEEWSQFVDDAEGALSREHTLWRARRRLLRPPSA